MKKLLIFLMLAFFISSCDEKPIEPEKLEDIDFNLIKFTPDSINLKPGFSYIIEFTGINFSKAKIDSIIIDNKKLEIVEITENKIISKIHNANPGTFKIEFYQEGKVFILDKKIIFIPMEYKEPTKDNIYFLPDTIFIDENNKSIQFTLYGTDFEKYKIDEVYLNSKKAFVNKVFKDSAQVVYQYLVSGFNKIRFKYKGEYIYLDKQIFVLIKNSLLNLSSNNFVSIECRNIPIREGTTSEHYSGTIYSRTDTAKNLNFSLPLTSLTSLAAADIYSPTEFKIHTGSFSTGLDLSLSIDIENKKIKFFEFLYSNWSDGDTWQKKSEKRYKVENISYQLMEFNGNPQIVAEIYGKDLDICYPLIYYYQYSKYGNTTRDISTSAYIIRKDSITGKQINYYPATDSSYIRITIGN